MPGASALRALGRYLIVFDMLVIVTVVYSLDKWLESSKALGAGRVPFGNGLALTLLAGILIAEQANGMPYTLDKEQEMAFLGGYQRPANGCQAFFINNLPTTDLPVGYYQLDAMMISMNLRLPTLNGYSGMSPNEVFSMLPSGVEYKFRMLKWLRLNNVENGICELDYQSHTFRRVNVATEYEKYAQLDQASYLDSFSVLFAAAERFCRDKIDVSNFYPQYLEGHGYLNPSFGYGTGPAYKWIQDRYWLGERPCRNGPCIGVGIVGTYGEIQGIIQEYGTRSAQIFFPYPENWVANSLIPAETKGELLLVFPVAIFEQ